LISMVAMLGTSRADNTPVLMPPYDPNMGLGPGKGLFPRPCPN